MYDRYHHMQYNQMRQVDEIWRSLAPRERSPFIELSRRSIDIDCPRLGANRQGNADQVLSYTISARDVDKVEMKIDLGTFSSSGGWRSVDPQEATSLSGVLTVDGTLNAIFTVNTVRGTICICYSVPAENGVRPGQALAWLRPAARRCGCLWVGPPGLRFFIPPAHTIPDAVLVQDGSERSTA